MPKNSLNVSLKGADDIFSTEEFRQEQQREQVQQIPIGELFPFKNHSFKVLDDESMQRTVESVEQYGVLSPLTARPRLEGGYEIISGHRRQHAAQLAGLDALPVIVRNMDDDAAVLLIDHQTGLFNLVRDFEPIQFKNNVLALADSAKFFNLPTILTTSFDNGHNGPLLPEIIEMFPEAPLIRRPGQINAWDNEEFVAAVKKTGKKQLIIAGIVTDVCVAFAALSAVEAGYEVFVVTDASGTFNAEVRDAAWRRMEAAGVQLVNFFSVACELHRDWRNDMEGLAALLGKYIPAYQNIMTSFSAK